MIKYHSIRVSANFKYKQSKPIAMLTLVDNALTILKDCMHFEGWVVLHLKNSLAMSMSSDLLDYQNQDCNYSLMKLELFQ
jgi:hypothetical protein